MWKAAAILAVVTVAAHMVVTINNGMKAEQEYFNFLASGEFLRQN